MDDEQDVKDEKSVQSKEKDHKRHLSKDQHNIINYAEIFDTYRIIPRIILALYGYMVYDVVGWFMALSNPSTQQVTLVSTVVGAAAIVIGLYNNSGRKWSD